MTTFTLMPALAGLAAGAPGSEAASTSAKRAFDVLKPMVPEFAMLLPIMSIAVAAPVNPLTLDARLMSQIPFRSAAYSVRLLEFGVRFMMACLE
jgi:hypothetical protein